MRDMAAVELAQQRAQHLMANGRVGQATITHVTDTGVRLGDNPQVQIDLMVSLDGAPAYPASVTQVISRLAVANFQPGASVPVRVDPADPAELIIA
jgi:Protein of unknown function (DUF3592)